MVGDLIDYLWMWLKVEKLNVLDPVNIFIDQIDKQCFLTPGVNSQVSLVFVLRNSI